MAPSSFESLQCPFTWGDLPRLGQSDREDLVDRLGVSPTPWSTTISKLKLALQPYTHQTPAKARKRKQIREQTGSGSSGSTSARESMIEAYMALFPFLNEHPCPDCVLEEYRVAMRHVLDATWAHMTLREVGDEVDGDLEDLEELVRNIPGWRTLDSRQQAAVYAIRASLARYPDNIRWIQRAIFLNPTEEQWFCDLGQMMLDHERRTGGSPTASRWKRVREVARRAFSMAGEPFALFQANPAGVLEFGKSHSSSEIKAIKCPKLQTTVLTYEVFYNFAGVCHCETHTLCFAALADIVMTRHLNRVIASASSADEHVHRHGDAKGTAQNCVLCVEAPDAGYVYMCKGILSTGSLSLGGRDDRQYGMFFLDMLIRLTNNSRFARQMKAKCQTKKPVSYRRTGNK